MDAQAIGIVVVAMVTSAGGIWASIQIVAWVWNKKASAADVEELKTGFHKLRGSVVTTETLAARKEEVDRRFDEHDKDLDQRREDVRELYKEVAEIRKDMNTGFQETQRLILGHLK